ncbi:MAG TPA: DUF1800 domain-containing protein [Candidatus Acidoferrales bacterium]|nr:DUF1800 domain-containing protein [Candidatus Acidoferrales bacterium]
MRLDTSTDPQVGFRPPGSLGPDALAPYDGHFGPRQAAHLLRRAGFGPTPAEVIDFTALGMQAAVERLLHPAEPDLDFPDYPDTQMLFDPKTRTRAAQMWWLDRILRTRHPLIEKMTLFWHGHFATSIRKVPAALMVEQIDLFRSQALGNFGTLLLSVSRDPAMLVWLDNRANYKAHPNENYAREVMELFSLGLGNYTEDDVKNAARAFTGWTLDKDQHFIFRPAAHDDDGKTFLGHTGDFDGADIVDIIVEQPIHQRFLCRKLLEFFVYSDPEPELTEGLAQVYALSGYDIARVVGTIIRSNVFYSSRAYRAIPKSPIEYSIGLYRYLGIPTIPPDTISWLQRMGQEPMAPPSVKGWDGGPTWISTATLLARFNLVNKLVHVTPPKTPTPPAMLAGTMMETAPTPAPAPEQTWPTLTPDSLVAAAGGINGPRILELVVAGAVQDDVTSDVRATLMDYLDSKDASLPVPLGPENYQEKIRGLLSLVLNLPSNQLD